MKLPLALAALAAACAAAPAARAQQPSAEQAKAAGEVDFSAVLREALKPKLPSYAETRRWELQRELSQRPMGQAPGAEPPFDLNSGSDPERRYSSIPRFLTESVDLNVARPQKRLTLGVGYSDRRTVVAGRSVSHDVQRYGFLKLELGRRVEAREPGRRRLKLPTATYTETEISPNLRFARDEWSWKVLRKDAARSLP